MSFAGPQSLGLAIVGVEGEFPVPVYPVGQCFLGDGDGEGYCYEGEHRQQRCQRCHCSLPHGPGSGAGVHGGVSLPHWMAPWVACLRCLTATAFSRVAAVSAAGAMSSLMCFLAVSTLWRTGCNPLFGSWWLFVVGWIFFGFNCVCSPGGQIFSGRWFSERRCRLPSTSACRGIGVSSGNYCIGGLGFFYPTGAYDGGRIFMSDTVWGCCLRWWGGDSMGGVVAPSWRGNWHGGELLVQHAACAGVKLGLGVGAVGWGGIGWAVSVSRWAASSVPVAGLVGALVVALVGAAEFGGD